jgi:V8-like Glu-specific endopeptidase
MTRLVGSILFVSFLSLNVNATEKVIYGEDNRKDVFESTNSLFVDLSESTAAMIQHSNIKRDGSNNFRIESASFASSMGMCRTERFASQPSAANCSGFLVGDKYLVTAGHCIESQSDCDSYSWVFNFKLSSAGQNQFNVSKDDVYKCKRIVSQSLDRSTMDDFALIELDRVAVGKRPLEFRTEGRPAAGDEILVIGHPSGLPTKITDGAKIRSLEGKYFVANLDTYGGNSGSAVFNATSGVVEGILVRGETDYVWSSQGCRISYVVADEAGRGEDVTYITNIRALMDMVK